MSSTWFITGASRGMGRELTAQAVARGNRVAATLRTPSQLDDLAAAHGHRLWVRQLDVTDTVQMGRVVEEAFTAHEHIDVVVLPRSSSPSRGLRVSLYTRALPTEKLQKRSASC